MFYVILSAQMFTLHTLYMWVSRLLYLHTCKLLFLSRQVLPQSITLPPDAVHKLKPPASRVDGEADSLLEKRLSLLNNAAPIDRTSLSEDSDRFVNVTTSC